MYGRLIISAVLLGATTAVASCVSHEAHVANDAQTCQTMGHTPGSHDYDVCMKALNQRRCEDRTNRDPMCQSPGSK